MKMTRGMKFISDHPSRIRTSTSDNRQRTVHLSSHVENINRMYASSKIIICSMLRSVQMINSLAFTKILVWQMPYLLYWFRRPCYNMCFSDKYF